MRVKEESEKVGLKLNIQKTKIMASGPITSWEIYGVGSSRQVSTHVPHLVPHTQRVGEYGQGQEEPNGGQVAGQGLVAGSNTLAT